MAGLVIQVYESLVEVDILELSMFPYHGVGICHTSTGLWMMMVKELDRNLSLGMVKMRKTESPRDEESWGGGFESRSDPKSPSLAVSYPFGNRAGLGIARTLNTVQKKLQLLVS